MGQASSIKETFHPWICGKEEFSGMFRSKIECSHVFASCFMLFRASELGPQAPNRLV